MQGQRPHGLALWTDKDLSMFCWEHFGGVSQTETSLEEPALVMMVEMLQCMLGLMTVHVKSEDLFISMH